MTLNQSYSTHVVKSLIEQCTAGRYHTHTHSPHTHPNTQTHIHRPATYAYIVASTPSRWRPCWHIIRPTPHDDSNYVYGHNLKFPSSRSRLPFRLLIIMMMPSLTALRGAHAGGIEQSNECCERREQKSPIRPHLSPRNSSTLFSERERGRKRGER